MAALLHGYSSAGFENAAYTRPVVPAWADCTRPVVPVIISPHRSQPIGGSPRKLFCDSVLGREIGRSNFDTLFSLLLREVERRGNLLFPSALG